MGYLSIKDLVFSYWNKFGANYEIINFAVLSFIINLNSTLHKDYFLRNFYYYQRYFLHIAFQ
jgi:hypothetical protein